MNEEKGTGTVERNEAQREAQLALRAPSTGAPLPGGFAPLWSVADCARYLGRSVRWVQNALTRRDDEHGSIPHIRLGRAPRFIPEDVATWVAGGCPPAAVFRAWKEAREKEPGKKRKVPLAFGMLGSRLKT